MSVVGLREQLMRDEGLRLHAYTDSLGVWTIGYGRNLQSMSISIELALMWLDEDIERHSRELLVRLPWISQLNPPRRSVLFNMAFNLGVFGLLKFHKMLAATEGGDYDAASREMLDSRWHAQVGKRCERLAEQMRTGEWV